MTISGATYSSHAGRTTRKFSRGQADDYIYPVHLLDGAEYQHCILTLFIKFNDILDAEKIKDSLTRLLEIGDWKKLGGRFRTKVDGRKQSKALEIHVPRKYTAERPAIQFAYEAYNSSIFEHPLGRQLPQSSNDGVAISPPLDELRPFGHAPGFPMTMADLVDKDAPQLCFKVIGYTDATILAITFCHCTWDVSGLQGFLKSLELVLDGREDEVPPMLGANTDILPELIGHYDVSHRDAESLNVPEEKEAMEQPQTSNTALEQRIIRVPLGNMERLHNRVAMESPMDDEEALSTYQLDELFLALIVQQIARAQPEPRALRLLNVFNARLVVPRLAKARGVYSQNLVLLTPQTLSNEAATGPMGQIALAQRECFAQSAEPESITRSLHMVLGAIEAELDITRLTDCNDAESVLVNNLVRLSNYIDLDLSSAVVRQGEISATRRNGLGTADSCYLTLPPNSYGMMRVTTLGSYNGNSCWMIGELPARAWELIYEALDELEW
ncbi:hypothetical protein ANOM_000019 [Aspergillus nomiae NRRL 13137]|uniref:O-acetyltransferase n=1 Tax=Aspergillus nomiae NRRL (strain ATCC 15546 / NRRL 13137 / CBS 260.88 / M93) TaxID=1509407 RepID=A0A0L1JIC5_ASPN3|nr:uncharacterized protein ANOM_000019 [Aspergillus nomiae NRRL 13137]KNG91514.1 hypothetical protein ANOM_000019 [Aspergillus nomiae NRRL 13137]